MNVHVTVSSGRASIVIGFPLVPLLSPAPAQLDDVKSHLRYQFAIGMDSTSSIASTLAHYLGLRRTPETINKRYELYRKVTGEDVMRVAQKYFVEKGRTIATLKFEAEAGKARP